MSVWDKTTPAGSDPKSQGDDRIRELKTAVEEALQGGTTEGLEAIFPGSAPTTAPRFSYRGLKGSTGSRPVAGQYGLYFDTTRNVLQRDNSSSWDDVGTVIPAGTVMPFFQAAAPVGWTQVVSQNDKVLRVVSTTGGGSGGTIATSTTLAHTHTVAAHHHTIAHKHAVPVGHVSTTTYIADSTNWGAGTDAQGSALAYQMAAAGFGPQTITYMKTKDADAANSGDATPATDSQLAGALAYADVILASKD